MIDSSHSYHQNIPVFFIAIFVLIFCFDFLYDFVEHIYFFEAHLKSFIDGTADCLEELVQK